MNQGVQEKTIKENADEKDVGSCDRCERRVYAKKRKGLPTIEKRKRRYKGIYLGAVEEGIYLAVKVTTNGTSVLCRKEEWKETDGTGLQISE